MKNFFSRLHDSTPTGRSKPTTREAYKLWSPPVDAENDYIQQSATPNDIPTHPTSRLYGERSSSTRPKTSQTTHVSAIDRNTANNAAAGSSSERLPESSVKPNPPVATQDTRTPVQATAKSTSTRYKDHKDAKLYPPSTTRPSQSTRTYGVYENPTKVSRHPVLRSESTPPTAAQMWVVPPVASTSRQVEELHNEPMRQAAPTDPVLHLRNEEKASEAVKREREKLRYKDRERDRGRGRDKELDRGRDKERGREGESDREHFRHQGKDREVDPERDRGKGRGNELDREKDLMQRGREKERQRDLAREDHDREKVLDGRARDKEQRRERDRREQEMEYRRQVDTARDSDRERLEKEARRPVDASKDTGLPSRDRERQPRRQTESRQRRERDYRQDPYVNRERVEREGVQQEPDRTHSVEPSAEVDRALERNRHLQRQAETAKAEREAERVLELQRQKDTKAERDAERAREIQRHKEAAKAERDARAQRQAEAVKAEQEAEHVKQLQRRTETPDADRLKDLPRQTELGRVKESQRQVEIARAERESERQRQWEADQQHLVEPVNPERDGARQRYLQAAKEAERLRQKDIERQHQSDAEKAERDAEILRHAEAERQRRLETERAGRETERHRQLEVAKAEREAERLRHLEAERLRRLEAEKAEREAEYMRQLEADRQHRLEAEKAQREAERIRQAELDRQRRLESEKAHHESERLRQAEAERQNRLEVERAEREAERHRRFEIERAERETERLRQVEIERQRRSEAEKAEREAERLRLVEIDRQHRLEAEMAEREALRQRRLDAEKAERDAERMRQLEADRQRRLEIERAEREAERQRRLEAERAEREAERIKQEEVERLRRYQIEKADREAERIRQAEADRQRRLEAEAANREFEHQQLEKRRLEVERAEREAERIRQAELELRRLLESEKAERESERLRQMEAERQLLEAERVEREAERLHQVEAERQRQLELEKAEREAERTRRAEAERQRRLESERADREAERTRQAEVERQRQLEYERAEREAERQRQLELERAEREAERTRRAETERQRRLELERAEREAERLRQMEAERQLMEAEAERVEREAERLRQVEAERQRQLELEKAEREAERTRQADAERQRQVELEKAERQRRLELERTERDAERTRQADAERQRQLELEKVERTRHAEAERQRRLELERAERETERLRQAEVEQREADRTREYGRQIDAEEAKREIKRPRDIQIQMEASTRVEQEVEHAAAKLERDAERVRELQRKIQAVKAERELQRQAEAAWAEREAERVKGLQRHAETVKVQGEARSAREPQRQGEVQRTERKASRGGESQLQVETELKPENSHNAERHPDINKLQMERTVDPSQQPDGIMTEHEAQRNRQTQTRSEAMWAERDAARKKQSRRQPEAIAEREKERETGRSQDHIAEGVKDPLQDARQKMELQLPPNAFTAELGHSEEGKRMIARETDVHRVLHNVENFEGSRSHLNQDKFERASRETIFDSINKNPDRILEQTVGNSDAALHRPRERKEWLNDGGFNKFANNRKANADSMPSKSSPKANDQLEVNNPVHWGSQQPTNDHIVRGHRKRDETRRSRAKYQDDGKYRAEFTDGEQDTRRFKQHTSTNRNVRRDHGSGSMSDSYETRNVSRQRVSDSVQNRDVEGTNGSPSQKVSRLLANQHSSEGVKDSKDNKAHYDKRPEAIQPTTNISLNHAMSKALPDVPDNRHPSKTADQQQEVKEPNSSPSTRAQEVLGTISPHNDTVDFPVRREITRLKLQARQEDPPVPHNVVPTSGSVTPPFRSQITFQPSQQPSATVDSTPALIYSQSLPPYSLESSPSTGLPSLIPSKLEPKPVATPIQSSSPSTGQRTVLHQQEPVDSIVLGPDSPLRTENAGLEFGHDFEFGGSIQMFDQNLAGTHKSSQGTEPVRQQIGVMPSPDTVEVKTKPNPQTQIVTPFASRRNLLGDGHIKVENTVNLLPEGRELRMGALMSSSKDATEFKIHSLGEHSRHNSTIQPVLPTVHNAVETVETTINNSPADRQLSDGHSVVTMSVPTAGVEGFRPHLPTDLQTTSALINTQSSPTGTTTQQDIGVTALQASQGATWEQDGMGLSSRFMKSTASILYSVNPQYKTTVFTESPTSGLIKTNLPGELKNNKESNISTRQNTVIWDNLPASSESLSKGFVQESTAIQLTDPQMSAPSIKMSESRRPSVTAFVSKQDSPLRSTPKPLETTNNFSQPFVPDRLANVSSTSLFVPASVPVIASSLPSMATAPRQWHENPPSSTYVSLSAPPVQERQWSTRQTNSTDADIAPEQEQTQDKSKRSESRLIDTRAITTVHGRPKQHASNAIQQNHVQLSGFPTVDTPQVKNDLVEVDGNRLPNLGFYSSNFSRVLSKTVNEEISNQSHVREHSAPMGKESGRRNNHQESGDHHKYPLSSQRDKEGPLHASHAFDGDSGTRPSQSLQRSSEQVLHTAKEGVGHVENAAGQSRQPTIPAPEQIVLSTQQIERPIPAELLSPLAGQAAALVTARKTPQVRQRTTSSSHMNSTPAELYGHHRSPADLHDKQGMPSSLQRMPSEQPKNPVVDNRRDAQQTTAASTPLVQQPLVDGGQHEDIMQNVNAYNPTDQPKRMFSVEEDKFAHGSRTPLQKPLVVQEVSNPTQDKDAYAIVVEPLRHTSNNRYQPGQTQRMSSNPTTEISTHGRESTIVQQNSRTGSSTAFQSRRQADYPQKAVAEQHNEHHVHESLGHGSKPSSNQLSAFQTQSSFSRVPSSSTPIPTADRPAASGYQGAPIERNTISRQGVHRSNDVKPARERKTDDYSRTQNQVSSTSRTMHAESSQQRQYPQTSADSRFPNVPAVLTSQISGSAMHHSSRHQHSTSLPASLPPVVPTSTVNNPSREELQRTSTPAPNQRKISSSQANSVPPYVSTSSLRMRKDPSEETILLTATALAQSTQSKPTSSRNASDPPQPHVSHSQPSRTASNQTAAGASQYQIWQPNRATRTESSPKATQSQAEPAVSHSAPRKPPPPPIAIPVTIHDTRHPPAHVLSPFRYLTTKRNRAVSVASLEAQDGTAANTVVGSPTASMHSTVPIQLPPVRDVRIATEEWRNKEEAAAHALAKAKRRRQRPGVVFDVAEDNPNEVKQRPRRVKTKARSSSRTPAASQS